VHDNPVLKTGNPSRIFIWRKSSVVKDAPDFELSKTGYFKTLLGIFPGILIGILIWNVPLNPLYFSSGV